MAGIPDEVPLQLPAEGRGRGRGKGKGRGRGRAQKKAPEYEDEDLDCEDEAAVALLDEASEAEAGKVMMKRPAAKAKACAAKKQTKACCVLNSDFSVRSLHIMIFVVAGRSWS